MEGKVASSRPAYFAVMKLSVPEIEAAVGALSEADRKELYRRLDEQRAEAWDRQIEQDAKAGRLDFLLDELDAEIAAGTTRRCA